MFGIAFEMALLPARLAIRSLRWASRRWRGRARPWQSMAVPAFPLQLPAPAPAAVAAGAGPAAAASSLGGGGETEDAARRAASPNPYEEAWGNREYVLASFHTREGDGFKLVFHFQLKKQRVRRVVWLDFTRLAKRMGREPAWAMRARLGQSQMRYAVDRPSHPWGRLELPDAWLTVDSTRGQKARTFMLETLDAVNQLIDAGGIDLVSGRHQTLPPGDPRPTESAVLPPAGSGRSAGRSASSRRSSATQAELPLSGHGGGGQVGPAGEPGGAPVEGYPPTPPTLPDRSEDASGLPTGVTPEHVCTGILAGAGVTERSDASGRQYRIFYADVDVAGRISRQTGADLERALQDAGAHVGSRVRLQHLGYVPVNGGRHRRKVWQATVVPG
jgi:hypothetical protein